jgi:EmrB/QacA subfamily drug resistance transporter
VEGGNVDRVRSAPAVAPLSSRQRWILFAASLAVGLAFLDETAVVTALRTIQREFNATSAETQWIMGSYLLALASLMAASGRLADLYGRKRLFIIGALLFGLGSIGCAAAPSEELLIAARAVQGCGGALLMPGGLANATASLPEQRRGWAVGVVSTGATVFLALGPLIGGSLTELVGWRWIFLINLPTTTAIILVALRWLPETRAEHPEPLDVAGFAVLVGGLVALVLALLNLQDWGIGAVQTIVLLCGGAGLLVTFVVLEHRVAYPLIDLRLLVIPSVSGSLCALFAIQFAILGLTVYLTLYLQHVLGYSPAAAGALTLPTVAAAPLLSTWVGRTSDRLGTRGLTAGSMALAAVAVAWIAVFSSRRDVVLLLPAFLAFGVARPIATIAASTGTVGAIPRNARGLSSALVTESRQLGAVLGVAVLGLVLTGLELAQRNDLLRGVDARFGHQRREALDGILAGSGEASHLLAGLSRGARHQATEAAATSFVSGFRGAMIVTAVLAGLAAVASWVLVRPNEQAVAVPGAPAVVGSEPA